MDSMRSKGRTFQTVAWGYTRSGPGRSVNEDGFRITPYGESHTQVLAAVADGMGGHRAGNVASRLALETLVCEVVNSTPQPDLSEAFRAANACVHQAGCSRSEWLGMGTTLTAILTKGLTFTVCHVGDSRAYRYSACDDTLTRLTTDHSLVDDTQEAVGMLSGQNVLTRAVGVSDSVDVDVFEYTAEPGDRLVLCTDGITKQLSHHMLTALVTSEVPIEELPRRIVEQAVERGERDDLTVVTIEWLSSPGGERE